MFAGELIERFDFVADPTTAPPGVVVVGIMVVDDASLFRDTFARNETCS